MDIAIISTLVVYYTTFNSIFDLFKLLSKIVFSIFDFLKEK